MSGTTLGSRLLAALAIAGAMLLLAGCGSRPAAVVNGTKITESELNQRLRLQYGAQTLQLMIDTQIIRDAFNKAGLQLPPEEITKAIESRFGSMEQFQKLATDNNLKPEEFIQQVLAPQLMLQKLATKDIQVAPQETADFYKRNQAHYDVPESVTFRQIIVSQKADAQKVMAALAAGGDFQQLVTQYSIDPDTRQTGGLVADLPIPGLPAGLKQAVAALKEGQTSPPLNVEQMWVILKLETRTPAQKRSFEQVQTQVQEDVVRSKLSQDAVVNLRAKLRRDAKVSIVSTEFQSLSEEFRQVEIPQFGGEQPPGGATPGAAPQGTPAPTAPPAAPAPVAPGP